MTKNLLSILILTTLAFGLFSCKKELTDYSGGTASYTFEGAPGGCTSPVVSGNYDVGNAVGATNTVSISVNVRALGTYAIRTNAVNGIQFAGTGSFSSIGIQTIVLKASGTPGRTGNFTFVPTNTNTNGCNFTVTVGAATGGGGTNALFTYAGAPGSCTSPSIGGIYYNTVTLNATNTVDLNVNVTTIGTYNITTNTANGISFTASGNFTSTGNQTVRLRGQGTPNATGSASFTPTGGCSFSINIVAAPAAGVFTYNCTIPPQVLGTYTSGTALNATNTIVIAVNVTTAGSYSVTTGAAVNGVTFSGSGVFAATGPQLITLTSTNTPTAAGNFAYTPSGTGGCAFNVTYGTGGGGGTDFLKCTIDGVLINFNDGLAGGFLPSGEYQTIGSNSTISEFGVTVTNLNGPVTVGTYKNQSLSNPNSYCDVFFIPDNGNPLNDWSPDQSIPNSFTVIITSLTANRVMGTFSGDIYDLTGANKKVVTNGSFSVQR